MPAHRRSREQPVRLTTFDNEPLAKLAEQRLRQEGIPCLIRSLQGGPGLWGSAYNLPHGLYVYQSDVLRARAVLDLPAVETKERGAVEAGATRGPAWWVIILAVGALLVLIIAGPYLAGLFGG